jgi:hypothetical protein
MVLLLPLLLLLLDDLDQAKLRVGWSMNEGVGDQVTSLR